MGEQAEPDGSHGEGAERGDGGEGEGAGKGAVAGAPDGGQEGSDDGVAEQVSASWSEKLGNAAQAVRGKDGQAHGSLSEVCDGSGEGEARGKQQGQQQDGKGLQGDGDRGKEQGNGEMSADGDQGGADEDDAGSLGQLGGG